MEKTECEYVKRIGTVQQESGHFLDRSHTTAFLQYKRVANQITLNNAASPFPKEYGVLLTEIRG